MPQGFLDLYVNFHFVESAALPGPPVDLRQLRVGGGHRRASAGGESDAAVAAATSGMHGMLAGLQIFDRPIRAHKEVCDGSAPGLLGWWAFAGACVWREATTSSQHTLLYLRCHAVVLHCHSTPCVPFPALLCRVYAPFIQPTDTESVHDDHTSCLVLAQLTMVEPSLTCLRMAGTR